MPFNYVKVPKSKNELSHVHVGQKRPFTQKIRSLGKKRAILVFLGVSKKVRHVCRIGQKSKNELTRLHVGQKHPFTQKIRSLAQKQSILT
jgi:hypothetical protein